MFDWLVTIGALETSFIENAVLIREPKAVHRQANMRDRLLAWPDLRMHIVPLAPGLVPTEMGY